MAKQLSPERAIQYIRFSAALTLCWPLHSTSSKYRVYGYKVLQVAHILSTAATVSVALHSAYLQFNDLVNAFQIVAVSFSMIQMIITTIICIFKYETLQFILEDMEAYVKEAKQHEWEVFCKYIAKSHMFYGIYVLLVYATTIVFTLGPLVLPVSFPIDIVYPFSINSTAVYVTLYLHQSLISFQCTALICFSGFGALILWYIVARFECLATEVQKSSNIAMMIVCIKKQLQLLSYAETVAGTVRFIVLSAIGGSTCTLILCGMILTMNCPVILKVQFVGAILTLLIEVYMYTWPADYVKDMSENFAQSAYDITWYKQSLRMQKDLLNVLIYQKPVTISVSCLMPELTLEYFCSYLSNSVSIFTAMRAILVNK